MLGLVKHVRMLNGLRCRSQSLCTSPAGSRERDADWTGQVLLKSIPAVGQSQELILKSRGKCLAGCLAACKADPVSGDHAPAHVCLQRAMMGAVCQSRSKAAIKWE